MIQNFIVWSCAACFYSRVKAIKLVAKLGLMISLVLSLTACIGTVVGAVVDTAIEVAKVPVKVGGAIIDVVTPDDFIEQNRENGSEFDRLDTDSAAAQAEGEHL